MHQPSHRLHTRFAALCLACLLAMAAFLPALPAKAETGALSEQGGILLLPFDDSMILSIGNQTAGKCSWYCLRYARTILDGAACSGAGMWSGGAVWSAGGYATYAGQTDLAACLAELYAQLTAGRPVIVHLQNVHVPGASKHANRVTSYEYHRAGAGWNQVSYPHISTSATYGHWVCVVGVDAAADPANLKTSDFYALDPARVNVGGTLALTRLLDGTLWLGNSPLKVAG